MQTDIDSREGINGLAHECNKVCEEIDIPEIMNKLCNVKTPDKRDN